ncbi:tRNA wybutosine-synthesizing protein 2 [Mortierella sp. NVP41]|nr:tRNA wybutosine-synthesizing protein 2 [Mortierella sp. NVP41]
MDSTIPAVLAPGHLTKHLKVFLDKAGWRDKAKLITRYSQITITTTTSNKETPDQPTPQGERTTLDHDGYDLTQYMAMALLPVGPFSNINDHILSSLWDLTQSSSSPTSDLSAIDWPTPLSDPSLQKTIFLAWLNPASFPTPKHLLVQTPLEKLQQSASEFLLPYLQSWATSSNEEEPSLTPEILPELIASLPQKWEHYSDFTFLPPTAFLTAPWPAVLKRLVAMDQEQQQQQREKGHGSGGGGGIMDQWEKLVQDALGSSHIARKAIIPVQDILRRPKIRPLAGDWKLHNRYKSWIEQDSESNLLEHQDISGNSNDGSISRTGNNNNSAESTGLYESTHNNTTTTTDKDVLPTAENFDQTYWAETCQNQVWYRWSPMFTMFSAGNITEKERVAKSRPIFDARNKTVVDLYAGIGYFSLVYLIHAGARTVHACEWNPWSVEGLVRGAIRNEIPWKRYESAGVGVKVEEGLEGNQHFTTGQPTPRRPPLPTTHTNSNTNNAGKKQKEYGQLVVYPGDNAQWISYFENTAHHVNLGLIPSAEPGWVLAVRALCPLEGGYLHVHHNIRVGEEETFKTYLLRSLRDLFATWKKAPRGVGSEQQQQQRGWSIEIRHTENVKSFAPLVFHYVVDVECRPPATLP